MSIKTLVWVAEHHRDKIPPETHAIADEDAALLDHNISQDVDLPIRINEALVGPSKTAEDDPERVVP